MKTLDELVADRILDMLHFVLSKFVKPDITVNKVTELNKDLIKEIKQRYGIEGIILDVDETLRKDMKNIPEVNQEWIEGLRDQLKVIILSNGVDKKIEDYFKDKGISYISFACKPLKGNFLKACKKMGVEPDKVLVVGDSLFDDVYGGKRNKMRTALVKDVVNEDR